MRPAVIAAAEVLLTAALLLVTGPAAAAPRPSCDPLDRAACLLPWPNDLFTRADASSPTGRRLALAPAATPSTVEGRHIGVADLNRSDGFSPGSMIITRVAGLDSAAALRRSGAVTVTDPARYAARDQPILLIDTATGRRHPVMAEIDAQATSPAVADLLIRPASNLVEGRRYVVALRGLKTASGASIQAGRPFRVYRDRLPSSDPAVARRRPAMERIFATLGRAGVARRSLYLAWDFTVASGRGIAGRMLSIRNRAFAQLGDHNLSDLKVQGRAPRFRVTSVQDFTRDQDALVARRVRGEVEARTIGARLRRPALYPGRAGPWRRLYWGLRPVPRLPFDGTALVVMDSGPLRAGPGGSELGTPYPPVANVPPERGVDPHGLGGSSAEIRRLVARFLTPGGALVPACAGRPCTIAGWTGP